MAGKEFDPIKDQDCQGKRCQWFINFQCWSPDYIGDAVWRRCGGIICCDFCPVINPSLIQVEPERQISSMWEIVPVRVLYAQTPHVQPGGPGVA